MQSSTEKNNLDANYTFIQVNSLNKYVVNFLEHLKISSQAILETRSYPEIVQDPKVMFGKSNL